jgi:hypothetical protein
MLLFLRIRIVLFSTVAFKIKFKNLCKCTYDEYSAKKKIRKRLDLGGFLVVSEEKNRIRIFNSVVRIPEHGYALKRYGSGAPVLEEKAGQTGPSYLRKVRTFFVGTVFVQIAAKYEKEHIKRWASTLAKRSNARHRSNIRAPPRPLPPDECIQSVGMCVARGAGSDKSSAIFLFSEASNK